MSVIELSPGGGWYTEILANYIHKPGRLIAAHYNPKSERHTSDAAELHTIKN